MIIKSLENALATMKLLNSQQDPRYRAYLIKQLESAADQAGEALMKEHEQHVESCKSGLSNIMKESFYTTKTGAKVPITESLQFMIVDEDRNQILAVCLEFEAADRIVEALNTPDNQKLAELIFDLANEMSKTDGFKAGALHIAAGIVGGWK